VVMRLKRQAAEKAVQTKLDLIERVPMFGCLTDQHKQLLAGALEQVGFGGLLGCRRAGGGCAVSMRLMHLSRS